MFGALEQTEQQNGTRSKPPPGWVHSLRSQILTDHWEWLISSIADGVPSEMDYIEEHWTHFKIAKEYARMAARANSN